MTWDEQAYRAFFRLINNGPEPYGFQVDAARRLVAGQNLVLRAPTGSGKTATVLTPFLYPDWHPRPTRLIYALPLRTLAQSIYRAAQDMVARVGCDPDATVTIQTGEQPDDPFFAKGRIIVTTYDQVLSGLLHGPYGLPGKLHNVNAAAIAGALVIFDEFHLMEPQRAFLTGAACLYLFRDLAQSVWMTATATPPLVETLADALGADAAGPSDDEVLALPSVSSVTRRLRWESQPLSAAAIARHLDGRVVVIANTVARAQAIFKELTNSNPGVPATLLHARFFQSHRRQKEEWLRGMFGKGKKGPALLVATQVIEAGLDISCDHLHTELAPMNSLVQRAGRCARFEHEVGIVHVYSLPDEPRPWLPYGDLQAPDATLAPTRRVLEDYGGKDLRLTPTVAAEWVTLVHGPADRQSLAGGWPDRFGTILAQIYGTAISRQPSGIAHLIREPDTDDRRVILARQSSLPARPTERDALTLSRWRLAELLRRPVEHVGEPVGWFWEAGEQPGWRPLVAASQLLTTFVVALNPAYAHYDNDVGLEVGRPGEEESPPRSDPPRPGYKPLRAEPWTVHVRAVADEARRRLERDGAEGWLGQRVAQRFGLSPTALLQAAHACGLAHDLGKLQHDWQEWAAEMQRLRDPAYQHVVPLAHTDFGAADALERERARQVSTRRPDHSAPGAYLAIGLLGVLLSAAPPGVRTPVASACVAAVLGHHGGWLRSEAQGRQDMGLQPLWPGATKALAEVFGSEAGHRIQQLVDIRDRWGAMQQILQQSTGDDALKEWWPLVAYLTRTLRLSDQRATEEGGKSE